MDILYSPQTRRAVVGLLALGAATEGWPSDCTRAARALALPDHGPDDARLRYYSCSVANGAELSVQFIRLNDLLAGILLSGKSPEALPDLSQNATFVDNDVLREYRRLLSEYGENTALSTFTELLASAPDGSSQSSPPALQLERIAYAPRTLGLSGRIDYPEAGALQAMTTRRQIPPGYRTVDEQNIYRPMTKADVDNYEANVASYNRLIAGERAWYPSRRFRTDNVHPYMRLLKELASAGWPADFVHIFGYHDMNGACGEAKNSWQFSYSPRDVLLEVAVLAPGGTRAVHIDSLIGKRWINERLRNARSTAAGAAGSPREILALGRSIQPGQKLIVPVRIIWDSSDDLPEEAQRSVVRQYAWGPEWQIDGVKADGGETAFLQGRAANFLGVTTHSGEGSCPYLSAWDDDIGDWVNTGKILEDADRPSAEQADWRRFSGVVLRFKLSELETEVAVVRSVQLSLLLKTGVAVDAMPSTPDAQSEPFRLEFGDEVELAFHLPCGVQAHEVAASEIRLIGFYERYTDVLRTREYRRATVM